MVADYTRADVDVPLDDNQRKNTVDALVNLFANYADARLRNSRELTRVAERMDDLLELMYFIATRVGMDMEAKQQLLETDDLAHHINVLTEYLAKKSAEQSIEQELNDAVRRQMENNQREYFLNEKMKAIKNELTDLDDFDADDDLGELEQRLEEADLPEDVRKKAEQEFKKLTLMPPASSESSVVRNYIEWILDTPWKTATKASIKPTAQNCLMKTTMAERRERPHLGIFSGAPRKSFRSNSLLSRPLGGKLVGGIHRSSNGRKFVRMALGGVRDEAEIRGHRRTYIGQCCKIVQSLAKVEVNNPLFLLDEIDKWLKTSGATLPQHCLRC